MEFNFLKTCRICLCQKKSMISVSYPPVQFGKDVPLIDKIIAVCNVKINPLDELPQNICMTCAFIVKRAFNLRKISLNSEITLRRCLSNKLLSDAVASPTDCAGSGVLHFITVIEKKQSENQNSNSDLPAKLRSKKSAVKNSKCTECGKSFTYNSLLMEHIAASHQGDRSFLCSTCGLTFSRISILRNHQKVHSDDKPFHCDICSQSFRRRSNLIHHRRTHTGEKPYICEHCNRGFAKIYYLKDHMRLHSGEKPFVCEHCARGFARRSCLIMHRRIHTGELPYGCPECNSCFSQRSQRKRHVKTHHKNSTALGDNGELFLKNYDRVMAATNRKIKTEENAFTIRSCDYPICKIEPEFIMN